MPDVSLKVLKKYMRQHLEVKVPPAKFLSDGNALAQTSLRANGAYNNSAEGGSGRSRGVLVLRLGQPVEYRQMGEAVTKNPQRGSDDGSSAGNAARWLISVLGRNRDVNAAKIPGARDEGCSAEDRIGRPMPLPIVAV